MNTLHCIFQSSSDIIIINSAGREALPVIYEYYFEAEHADNLPGTYIRLLENPRENVEDE